MSERKLKVLMISGAFPYMRCGVADGTYKICEELKQTASIHVLVSNDESVDVSLAKGYDIYPSIKRWNILSLPKVISILRKVRPDVIHLQYPSVGYNQRTNIFILFLPFFVKLFSPGTPVILRLFDFAIGSLPSRLRVFPLLLFSDVYLTSNDKDEKSLKATFSFLARRIRRAYIGSNINVDNIPTIDSCIRKSSLCHSGESRNPSTLSCRAQCHWIPGQARNDGEIGHYFADINNVDENGDFTIVNFGFIQRSRPIHTLISAVKTLHEKGVRARLKIIGQPFAGEEPYLEILKATAKELNVEGSIEWKGYCTEEEVSHHLSDSDVCVLSFERGADLRRGTVVAALLHGIPIITCENTKYFIDEELRGIPSVLLYNPVDPEDLAGKCVMVYQDRAGFREKARRCRDEMGDKFSWPTIAKSILEIYEKACGKA